MIKRIIIALATILCFNKLYSNTVLFKDANKTDKIDRVHEFVNEKYQLDESLPKSLVINYSRERLELKEPSVYWIGGEPAYLIKFKKVIINGISMVLFSVPEEDWNEGHYGQLCWLLPTYNPTVIYQINTSYIANSNELDMESKYDANKIDDQNLKEWLKGIDLNKEPFKNIAGIESVDDTNCYFIVEFKIKKE